jgi:hypothetical protein
MAAVLDPEDKPKPPIPRDASGSGAVACLRPAPPPTFGLSSELKKQLPRPGVSGPEQVGVASGGLAGPTAVPWLLTAAMSGMEWKGGFFGPFGH